MTNSSSSKQKEEGGRHLKKHILLRNLRETLIDYAVGIDKEYQVNWHHELIAEKLEEALERAVKGKKTRIILSMPPRSGKSNLASIKFPTWALGRHPDIPIIVASYSGELATDFGMLARDLMQRENYKEVFDTRLRKDVKSKSKWMTEEGGGYTAVGVGGSVTGRGFRVGIIDDPLKNRAEAESERIRDKVWDWYRSVFYTRQDGTGAIVLITTRWHRDDLAGRLLRKAEEGGEEWTEIKFPAIATHDDRHREKGGALWPERFSKSDLEGIKNTLGIYNWASLYQQSPIVAETQEFKESYFHYIDDEALSKIGTRNFITIDTAVSQRESADYCGIVRNFVDSDGNWYVKAWRGRYTPMELINLIFSLNDQDRPNIIGIEDSAHVKVLRPFLEREMERRGTYPPVKGVKHSQRSKEARIRGLRPLYRTGQIFHVTGSCSDLEKELLNFPKGAHDDTLDALAYQLDIATKPPKRVVMSKEDKEFYKMIKKKRGGGRKPRGERDDYHFKMTR